MIRTKDGFTLLEVIVSISIIGLLTGIISQVLLTTLRTNTKTEVLKEMKQNGELALETISRLVQSAKNVSCPNGQSATIEHADGGITQLQCIKDGTSTRLASSSASSDAYLTSENITMGGTTCAQSSLVITCTAATGVTRAVTVTFDLARAGTPTSAFEYIKESFRTTVNMRNVPQ